MDNVTDGTCVFKKCSEASCTFRLYGFRTTGLMPLWTCFALGKQRLLQTADQLSVLAMSGDNDAQFLRQSERLIHLAIVHAKEVFVRKKNFEGSRSVAHDLAQLGLSVLIEPAHRHMKGVIASAPALSFFLPQVIPRQSVLSSGRAAHLNECRRAADQCRNAGCLMSIFGKRGHEGQIDVYMRIDESGKDPLARRIDDLGSRQNREIRADPRDRLILNVYLGFVTSIRSYDFTATNQ